MDPITVCRELRTPKSQVCFGKDEECGAGSHPGVPGVPRAARGQNGAGCEGGCRLAIWPLDGWKSQLDRLGADVSVWQNVHLKSKNRDLRQTTWDLPCKNKDLINKDWD